MPRTRQAAARPRPGRALLNATSMPTSVGMEETRQAMSWTLCSVRSDVCLAMAW